MTTGGEVEWCCTTQLTQANLIYYDLTYSAFEFGQFARHTLGPYQLYLLWTIIFINIAIYLALTEASIVWDIGYLRLMENRWGFCIQEYYILVRDKVF